LLVPALIAFQSLAAGETCPAAVDVQARVRSILHLASEQQLSESFLVERHEAGLYVVLKSADSSVIGERTLPLQGSCDELAQAAAVVLSAWLTHVHPDFAGALPAPEPAPELEAPPPPPPAEPPQAPPKRPAAVVVPSDPVSRAPPNPARFDWGLGAGADLSGGVLAPAALASVGYGPESFGFGLAAQIMVTTTREEPLGAGWVRWRRWPLGVGLSLRASSPGLRWDFSGGPLVAWLNLVGRNFATDYTEDAAAWGGFLTVRASGRGRFAPFALANVQYYPGHSVASVVRRSASSQALVEVAEWPIPPLTFLVMLGARFAH
jgi:hypothetical protein